MSDFFDSSWLIASLTEDEPHHESCREQLNRALENHSAVAAHHSIAEVFHTLTGKKQVSAEQVALLLRHNFAACKWVGFSIHDYWYAVETAQTLGVRGGAIFDVLLLRSAEEAQAERIFTLNKRHFLTFAPHLQDKIFGPA
jgi:predicted nucleic acid-binding protein